MYIPGDLTERDPAALGFDVVIAGKHRRPRTGHYRACF